jgi:D-alanyl-lipoteichoic acid acyltransferase DltB (MBOAT superfamily)
MLILTGLLRKLVIADNCALIANAAFAGRFGTPSTASVLIGTYAFAWQIYGDFSGYSDIARGSAQLMGFHFMVNFRQPYLARGLGDFWRRWHISLSTWLRDYLYIALGGNRHGERKTYRNLLLTMILGGLWHGANWTFVVWGAINGAGLAIERALGLRRRAHALEDQERVPRALGGARAWFGRVATFHVICLTWLFFRAPSVGAAGGLLSGLVHPGGASMLEAGRFLALFIVPGILIDLRLERWDEEYPFQKCSFGWRAVAAGTAAVAVALLAAGKTSAFIYFQF